MSILFFKVPLGTRRDGFGGFSGGLIDCSAKSATGSSLFSVE
jgi:hypothetical protein